MYEEVCCSNISSDIMKDMEFDPRNKWRKAISLKLNTTSTIGSVIATWDVVESGGLVASFLFFYFVSVRCQILKIQSFLAI